MTSSEPSVDCSSSDWEYEENVATLSKLMQAKTPPAANVVKQLLGLTRNKRKDWLKEEIAIRQILQKYPCFKLSKWVCA